MIVVYGNTPQETGAIDKWGVKLADVCPSRAAAATKAKRTVCMANNTLSLPPN